MAHPSLPPRRRAGSRRMRGFGYFEILLASAIASIGLMTVAAGALQEHGFAKAQESRSVALETMRHFVERLRGDEAWPTLNARLRDRILDVPPDVGFSPTVYYPDFLVPQTLGRVSVRVDVPYGMTPDPADPTALVPGLKEDSALPSFGLPFDLNGDGKIDSSSRDADYRALPIRVTFRWQPPGAMEQQLRVTTWLEGER